MVGIHDFWKLLVKIDFEMKFFIEMRFFIGVLNALLMSSVTTAQYSIALTLHIVSSLLANYI